MIPSDFIQTLLARVDAVEVIGRFVPLKKAGLNYAACCPFHTEKTPSFTVSPAKQFYHCFGCGAHGTAVGFLMQHQGLSYPEAVEELARGAGLTVPREGAPREERQGSLFEVTAAAARFFRQSLKASGRAVEYLKARGVSGEIAARFGLGYAPDDWQGLATAFPNYADPALVDAGLVIFKDGRRYDRFRDRIMFPIRDSRGRPIGFGGRVLGSGEPKYLNSPETPLFQKSQELYGLFEARRAVREAGSVLVVEGYLDVVALAQFGVAYAVATLGTSTTPQHVTKLLRQTDSLVFCFDGDEAGRKAAWRALEHVLAVLPDGKHAGFVFLPPGDDPDSLIRREGPAAFAERLDAALPASEFLIRGLTPAAGLATEEDKAQFLKQADGHLAKIQAPNLRLLLAKRIADTAGLQAHEFASLSRAKPLRAPQKNRQRAPAPNNLPISILPTSVAQRLLRALVADPALAAGPDRDLLDGASQGSEPLRELLDFLRRCPQIHSTAGLLQTVEGSPLATVVTRAQAEMLEMGEPLAEEFMAIRLQLEQERARAVLAELQGKSLSELSSQDQQRLRDAVRSQKIDRLRDLNGEDNPPHSCQ